MVNWIIGSENIDLKNVSLTSQFCYEPKISLKTNYIKIQNKII